MEKLVKTYQSEIKEEYAALPLSGREEYDRILKGDVSESASDKKSEAKPEEKPNPPPQGLDQYLDK